MGQTGELAGPDLRAGVRLESVREREPLLGHADGEPVLLWREGDEVSAVGGSCTHYGGPLIDGVIRDGVVRCPWHHACFSLRSGEAMAAPALNDLPQWRTEVAEGIVRVAGRIERDPLAPTWTSPHVAGRIERDPLAPAKATAGPASVVIIGAGAAGSAAAEMLRREGYAGPVTMIDPDADAPYDRPNLSKDYLAGNAPEEWIPLRPGGFYEEHGIERISAAATSIDVAQRIVNLSDGRSVSYGALLVATGATPIRPPIPGSDLPHVHVLRSLEDCRHLIAAAEGARSVVIAGASFIGMEAAASLRARELDVTIVAPEGVPFVRTLGPELGALLREEHERNGVTFQLGRTVKTIGASDVTLDDGATLQADVVLLGVGVRPVLDVARSAGIAEERGVPVDVYLETRVPGIHAAGDIAIFPDARSGAGIRIEHWVVAQRQGQTAARNILGRREAFTSVPFFWTNQFDIGLRYVGHAESWDTVQVEGSIAARDCAVHYVKDGVQLATVTLNRDRAALDAELAMESITRSTGEKHAHG